MKRILKNIAIIFFLLPCLVAKAGPGMQWVSMDKTAMSGFLSAMNKHYERMKEYSVVITSASYENYTTEAYHEKSAGYYKRSDKKYHSFMMGIHTIQNSSCRLVVDSSKGLAIVADPLQNMDYVFTVSEYETLLTHCIKVQTAQSGSFTYYRLDFEQGFSISSYELTFKDSLPQKVVIFYDKQVKQGSVMTRPRVEMIFTNWNISAVIKNEEFNINTYVTKEGDNYMLNTPYTDKFKLLDQRVQTRTTKK